MEIVEYPGSPPHHWATSINAVSLFLQTLENRAPIELRLNLCRMDEQEVRSIARVLETNTTVTSIMAGFFDIPHDNFHSNAVQLVPLVDLQRPFCTTFAAVLKSNSTLKRFQFVPLPLDLWMGDFACIVSGLKENSTCTLEMLGIYSPTACLVGSDSWRLCTIAKNLPSSLQSFSLRGWGCGGESIFGLLQILEPNDLLRHCELPSLVLLSDGELEVVEYLLEKSLRANLTVVDLSFGHLLSNNAIRLRIEKIIQQTIGENRFRLEFHLMPAILPLVLAKTRRPVLTYDLLVSRVDAIVVGLQGRARAQVWRE